MLHQASLWTVKDEFGLDLTDHLFLEKSNDVEFVFHLLAEACVPFISPTFQDGKRVESERSSFLQPSTDVIHVHSTPRRFNSIDALNDLLNDTVPCNILSQRDY